MPKKVPATDPTTGETISAMISQIVVKQRELRREVELLKTLTSQRESELKEQIVHLNLVTESELTDLHKKAAILERNKNALVLVGKLFKEHLRSTPQ